MTTAKPHFICRSFTVVELLFATAILGVVMAAMLNLYLFPFRVWYNNTAYWGLTIQGKLVRERILCGVDRNDAGLRAAMMSSLHLSHENSTNTDRLDYDVDMGLPPTIDTFNDDLNCAVRYNPGVGLVFQSTPGSGQPVPLSRRVADVGSLTFTMNNTTRILTAQAELRARNFRGGTILYPITIQTYIYNE